MMEEKYSLLLKKTRRELHMIPELGEEEYETSKYITDRLMSLGLDPQPCNKTGVVCFIDMGKSDTIALRSDIDALPVYEKNDVEYKSTHRGKMHACGHDGHMSMLLTMAQFITENQIHYNKNVLLIFQPAEEGPGGAEPMIAEGILERYNVTNVLGYHLAPDYPKGKIATRSGGFFACTTELYIEVKGRSSHAAQPEKGINAALIAAQIIVDVHNMLRGNEELKDECIVSIGTVNAGSKCNIIAGEAKLSGVIRAFSDELKETLIARVESICHNAAAVYGGTAKVDPVRLYPALINDEKMFLHVKGVLKDRFVLAKRTFLAEDFAYFAKARPSVYMQLGICDEKHFQPLHNDSFDFDESALVIGLEAYHDILSSF